MYDVTVVIYVIEDWPVMPVEHCSFKLKPVGFFTSSPIMDLPESSTSHGHCGGDTCPVHAAADHERDHGYHDGYAGVTKDV